MHMQYDLRPRKKDVNQESQPQTKKLSSSIYMYKVKEIKNITKIKEVGETSKGKKEVNELEELVSSLNFEKELSKINILVPLVELAKNPSYHK